MKINHRPRMNLNLDSLPDKLIHYFYSMKPFFFEYRIGGYRTPLLIRTPGDFFGRTLVIFGKTLSKYTVVF